MSALSRIDRIMKTWLSWVVKLCLTGGILYYIFTRIPLADVIHSVASARIGYVSMALGGAILTVIVAAWRFKLFTEKQKMSLSVKDIAQINFTTAFYGLFLPGALAEGALRWYRLGRPDGKFVEAFAAVVFGRLIWVISVMGFGIMFLLLDIQRASEHLTRSILMMLLVVGLCGLGLLAFNKGVSAGLFTRLNSDKAAWIPRVLREKLLVLVTAARRYHGVSRQSLARIIGPAVVENVLEILAAYCCVAALNLEISFVTIAWVRSLLLLLVMIPVSISGIGFREGALIILLAPYGIPGADAVALGWVLFSMSLAIAGVGGLLEATKKIRQRDPETPPRVS